MPQLVLRGNHPMAYHCAIMYNIMSTSMNKSHDDYCVVVLDENGDNELDLEPLNKYYHSLFYDRLYEFVGYRRDIGLPAAFYSRMMTVVRGSKSKSLKSTIIIDLTTCIDIDSIDMHATEAWLFEYMMEKQMFTGLQDTHQFNWLIWLLGPDAKRADVLTFKEIMDSRSSFSNFEMFLMIRKPWIAVHDLIIPRGVVLISGSILALTDDVIQSHVAYIDKCSCDVFVCLYGNLGSDGSSRDSEIMNLYGISADQFQIIKSDSSVDSNKVVIDLDIPTVPECDVILEMRAVYEGYKMIERYYAQGQRQGQGQSQQGQSQQVPDFGIRLSSAFKVSELDWNSIVVSSARASVLWLPDARYNGHRHIGGGGGCLTCDREYFVKKHTHHTNNICCIWWYGNWECFKMACELYLHLHYTSTSQNNNNNKVIRRMETEMQTETEPCLTHENLMRRMLTDIHCKSAAAIKGREKHVSTNACY